MDLFVLPFDHRGSFERSLAGIRDRSAAITAAKRVIYDGFRIAVEKGVPRASAAVLVDERYGMEILRDARSRGFLIACPTEKSGLAEFEFEHGEGFAEALRALEPDFAKALLRYNPQGDAALNRRQAARVRALSDDCLRSRTRLMLELLVPPTPSQLAWLADDLKRYDTALRPELMIEAMRQLQDSGIEPALWKLEGVDDAGTAAAIAAQAAAGGRRAGILVLGRGESEEAVIRWLEVATQVPGYVGFAIGRTVFWEPLKELWRASITREEAARRIADNYSALCRLWQRARQEALPPQPAAGLR